VKPGWNETHDASLTSWVASANEPGSDFPIQNLPLGVFVHGDSDPRAGIAIGDQILDLAALLEENLLEGLAADAVEACDRGGLNRLMALGRPYWVALRSAVSRLLRSDTGDRDAQTCLHPVSDCRLLLPAEIGDYTDFYASLHHATNVGSMFRPDNPLFPNYKYLPVGYHGRASSVVVSGTPVPRPHGQMEDGNSGTPVFGPSRLLDYECEVGAWIGPGNRLGEPISLEAAEDHLFGICLLNDWSARDLQRWEYQPLGPFLSKSFATSISPWIITLEALAPFRTARAARPAGDPEPLPHLEGAADRVSGGISLTVEVWLTSAKMRSEGKQPLRLSRASFADMYWTFGQMIAHHTSNGCNLRPGDLLGSGTVSGAAKDSRGCLLELTSRGTEPVKLPTGEERKFLIDGDEVILKGYCEPQLDKGRTARRIGLGECRGLIVG
jgi:fumarylacetoacetase